MYLLIDYLNEIHAQKLLCEQGKETLQKNGSKYTIYFPFLDFVNYRSVSFYCLPCQL
jgi:hypothetical protein